MRLSLLLITFLLIIQSSYSQIDSKGKENVLAGTKSAVSIDPVYFVLGTLSDYMGRFSYVEREKQIDRYYPFEKPMVNYLASYIKAELNITVDTIFEKSNHCKMYSDELSRKLNSFYGEKDQLLSSKFETNNQIYSYLTGVFYRYGDKLDASIYKIQLTNSPNHHNCYEFLKKIGCENVAYEYLKNIPAQFIYYFEPTEELKKYLNAIEPEREILKKSFYNEIENSMKGVQSKRKMKKSFQESKDKEIEKAKNAFNTEKNSN